MDMRDREDRAVEIIRKALCENHLGVGDLTGVLRHRNTKDGRQSADRAPVATIRTQVTDDARTSGGFGGHKLAS
jgi:hypothetical protein